MQVTMSNFPLLALANLCLVVLVPIPFSEAAIGLSHGEACSRFQRCNPRAFLNCANGHYCDCIKPKGMIYDESAKKCLTIAGEKCSPSSISNTNSKGLRLTSNLPCVPNAACKEEVCQCLPGFNPTSNGTCQDRQGHRENRDNCPNGGCKTSPSTSTAITATTTTSTPLTVPDQDIPITVASTISEVRISDTNISIPNEDSLVLPGHPCLGDAFNPEKTGTCQLGLLCRNHTCECPYKDHQEYGSTEGHCLSLIGGPCNSTENCIRDSECVIMTGGIKVCHCMKGFNPVDRKCELAYGEKCTQGENNLRKCDRLGPLECRLGKCACSDFQVYDEESLKCRGLVGSKCNKNDPTFCIQGADCKIFRGFIADFGICACSNTNLQSDRTCGEED